MMLPDLMHEVEIGGWKALFIHLLRILESVDEGLLTELDYRSDYSHYCSYVILTCGDHSYREIPSFGRDTIRSFSANCSEMKKMAAHDFENLLQVCSNVGFDHSCIADNIFSAPSLFLMDFFRNRITEWSCNYFSSWLTGMGWENCVFIMTIYWRSWITLPHLLARSFVRLARRHALLLPPGNFVESMMLVCAGKPKP
jgi:hypothetical protein